MKRKITLLVICMLIFSMSLCGCATYDRFIAAMQEADPQVVTEDTIKIGVLEPLTGSDATAAADEIKGIKLANSIYPTVLGKTVELVYADNQSDATAAVTAAQSLVDQNVSIVLGSYGNILTLAASDIFKFSRIPAIAVSCTNPLITKTNYYYSRICFIDSYQGQSVADYIASALEAYRVAILMEEGDDYASAMIEEFRETYVKGLNGLGSIVVVEYPSGTEDFTPYLDRIVNANCSVAYFPSSAAEASPVIIQSVANDYDIEWIGSSDWSELLTMTDDEKVVDHATGEVVNHLEGISFVSEFDADTRITAMTTIFLNAYKKAYGDEAPSENAALGFDAYILAIEGIKRAQSELDSAAIVYQINHIEGLECASGLIDMNTEGDPIRSVFIKKVINGEAVAVYSVAPERGADEDEEAESETEETSEDEETDETSN